MRNNTMTNKTEPTEQARGGADLMAALAGAHVATDSTDSTSTFDAEIAEILGTVAAAEPVHSGEQGDWYVQDQNTGPTALELAQAASTANDNSTRKVGEIKILRTDGKGMKHLVKQTYFAPDHSEAREIAQRMKDDGVLDSRFGPDYSFHEHMHKTLHPADMSLKPLTHTEFAERLAKLEQTTGVARSLPMMANAGFNVGEKLLELCDHDDEKAELLAAVASQLPAYLRGKSLREHMSIVEEVQEQAVKRALDDAFGPAFKRIQFEASAMAAGADAELLPELVEMAKTGKRMRLASMLTEAQWLIPLVPFGDAPDYQAAMLAVADFIPENGARWKAAVNFPRAAGTARPTYPDGKEPPAGTGRMDLSIGIKREGAAVIYTVRERHYDADAWGMMGTNNPFVVQAAFKVEAGEITELDVSAERAKNLEFLRGLAFEYGAGLNFADGWGALRGGAESAK